MATYMNKSVQWWVEFFMPLIVKCALPLRALSQAKYDDGVGDGILLVVENVTGNGKFNPAKGNVVDFMKKELNGTRTRQEERKLAIAGVKSLDAILNGMDDAEDENILSLGECEQDETQELDLFAIEMGNFLRLNTVENIQEPANPNEDAIKHGDPENDRIRYVVPMTSTSAEKYASTEVRFLSATKPSAISKVEVTAKEVNRSAAYYPDDDREISQAFAVFASIGDRDDSHFEEDGLSESGWLDMGEAPDEEGVVMDDDEKVEREDGDEVEMQPLDEYGEIPDPEFVPAEHLKVEARFFWQLQREMRQFDLVAEGIRHTAYLQYKGQQPVSVFALDKRGGFIKLDGTFLPMYKAAGIAAAIVPAKSTVEKMIEAVKHNFPKDPNAQLFVRRVAAVALLQ